MALTNKEILRLITMAGVGDNYRNPDVKLSSYPIAESISKDIKSKELTPTTGILLVDDKYDASETFHMAARFMAYPLRRSVYLCPSIVFYDLLRGNDTARLMTDDDERGLMVSKHLFLTDFVRDASKEHPFGSDMRIAVEDFIINARYRENKVVHLHSHLPVADWKCYSDRFKSFVVDNYNVYGTHKA